jgi:hypothetical protein
VVVAGGQPDAAGPDGFLGVLRGGGQLLVDGGVEDGPALAAVIALPGQGAPEVRIVSALMPGTTSPAGRTSTSTGSADVSRVNASWLASTARVVVT